MYILEKNYNGKFQKHLRIRATISVGHKTASVVMSQGFGYPAFPVDTHIHRLAQRWGLTNGKNVVQTEKDLKDYFQKYWNKLHYKLFTTEENIVKQEIVMD